MSVHTVGEKGSFRKIAAIYVRKIRECVTSWNSLHSESYNYLWWWVISDRIDNYLLRIRFLLIQNNLHTNKKSWNTPKPFFFLSPLSWKCFFFKTELIVNQEGSYISMSLFCSLGKFSCYTFQIGVGDSSVHSLSLSLSFFKTCVPGRLVW